MKTIMGKRKPRLENASKCKSRKNLLRNMFSNQEISECFFSKQEYNSLRKIFLFLPQENLTLNKNISQNENEVFS